MKLLAHKRTKAFIVYRQQENAALFSKGSSLPGFNALSRDLVSFIRHHFGSSTDMGSNCAKLDTGAWVHVVRGGLLGLVRSDPEKIDRLVQQRVYSLRLHCVTPLASAQALCSVIKSVRVRFEVCSYELSICSKPRNSIEHLEPRISALFADSSAKPQPQPSERKTTKIINHFASR